jgi:hypothetical protein
MRTSQRNLHHQLLRSGVLIFLNRAYGSLRGGKHNRPPSESPRLRISALVKSGKAQNEHIMSALPPKADEEQTCRHVGLSLFDHLVGTRTSGR